MVATKTVLRWTDGDGDCIRQPPAVDVRRLASLPLSVGLAAVQRQGQRGFKTPGSGRRMIAGSSVEAIRGTDPFGAANKRHCRPYCSPLRFTEHGPRRQVRC
jgi:hypothetical protein